METFKLWLSDDEFFGLLEAIDHLEAMSFSTDPVFNRILGVQFPGPQGRGWTKYVMSVVAKNIGGMTQGADFEDIATDVISGIVTDIEKGGSLSQAVQQAKQVSQTPEELLNNMRGVILNAAQLRAMDYRRRIKRRNARSSQFSQFDKKDDARRQMSDVPDHNDGPTNNRDLASYERMIATELEKMKNDAITRKETKLAKRLEIAQKVLPDRLAGIRLAEIMQKHGFTSKGTVQAIFDDISQALARVAGRLDNPILMHGLAKQGFGSNIAQGG